MKSSESEQFEEIEEKTKREVRSQSVEIIAPPPPPPPPFQSFAHFYAFLKDQIDALPKEKAVRAKMEIMLMFEATLARVLEENEAQQGTNATKQG